MIDAQAMQKAKLDKLAALEQKATLKHGLPFLYGFKDYKWSREFFESRRKMCLLTAANQIGKSTIQIRKVLNWATNVELWPFLWHRKPVMFWYLYPTKDVATLEFETKWAFLLPQGAFKDHPIYGWRAEYESKKIVQVIFNSGVRIVFKTYAQDVHTLQSGTCDYIACDEELPYELFDELKFRLMASRGYFSCVFTATLGQEFWRQAMEERGNQYERFPNADKWQISTFDCLKYEDGSNSHWTEEYIQEQIQLCSSEAEVQRRIFGRFVLTDGRKYENFTIKNNCRHGGPVPLDWLIYAGIDYGSGGEKGHPSAIAFLAVKPDFTAGRVVRAWRGDGIVTDASIVMLKYQEMKAELLQNGNALITSWYDYSAKDLHTVAQRLGESIAKADKSHERGEGVLNTLFKNHMLWLDEEQPEVMKLAFELTSLKQDTSKTKAKDDLTDATRYPAVSIPWNFTIVKGPLPAAPAQKELSEVDLRRDRQDFGRPEWTRDRHLVEEFEEWNELYGN